MSKTTYDDIYQLGTPAYQAYLLFVERRLEWLSRVNPEYHMAITMSAAQLPKEWRYKYWRTDWERLQATKKKNIPVSDDVPF